MRTIATIDLAIPVVCQGPQPMYERLAERAAHLAELGLPVTQIARRLGVEWKTAKDAIGWARGEGAADRKARRKRGRGQR
jgi:hypothetical protein